MFEEPVTAADLMTAWREAIRAAELAEPLAAAAAEAAAAYHDAEGRAARQGQRRPDRHEGR